MIASRLFMCLALGAGLFAWVVSIVGLIQHRAVWLMISGVCYAVQGEGVCVCVCEFCDANCLLNRLLLPTHTHTHTHTPYRCSTTNAYRTRLVCCGVSPWQPRLGVWSRLGWLSRLPPLLCLFLIHRRVAPSQAESCHI